MSPARYNTLKASLQAEPAKRSRFATAINFNTPANGVARHGSISARTVLTTASTATTISIYLFKPKTIWRYGMQKAVRVWKSRKGRKRQSSKNTLSICRTASKQVRRNQSTRAYPQRSSSRRTTEAEAHRVIKRTTLTLANPTHDSVNEVPVRGTIRVIRFSHPAVGAVMSALPTPASTVSFATGAAAVARSTNSDFQDFPTPQTVDFRGSVNPSDVHVRRGEITREQSDRRLDGLPLSRQIRSSSSTATQPRSDSATAHPHAQQPTTVTPRLPYMPAQPPFRANSLRDDLNRCSGVHDGPEAALAKLLQPQDPEIDPADFERFARQYGRRRRPPGNKPLPSAPGQGKFQSFQPGREVAPQQRPFVPMRPLPTPPMPMTPSPPPPPSPRAQQSQHQSYNPDGASNSAAPVPVFVPRAPLPPTPFTPQPSVRKRTATRTGPSRKTQEQHHPQSQAYDHAELDKMAGPAIPPKINSLKRKPVPPQNKKVRRSRLQADLPAVPEENDARTMAASADPASSSDHPEALRPAAPPAAARTLRPGSSVAAPVTAPTAAPPAELMNGMMQAMMQLTAEVQSLRARVEEISTSTVR